MGKKSRYNEEQIVCILREADKDPIAEVAKRYGVSEPSIDGWRKRFSSMRVANTCAIKKPQSGRKNAKIKLSPN